MSNRTLSYRHIAKAGNFADVMKHVVLLQVLELVLREEAALCFVDTHAGAGRYELRPSATVKTGAHADGILRLWSARQPPVTIRRYLEAIRGANTGEYGELRYYPGSPRLALGCLRPQDAALFVELDATAYAQLQTELADDPRVRLLKGDAYRLLTGGLASNKPKTVVLIDPPYVLDEEAGCLIEALATARRPETVYLLWYPIRSRAAWHEFQRAVAALNLPRLLRAEITVQAYRGPRQLRGCGMLIANAPVALRAQLSGALVWLWQRLSIDYRGGACVEWMSNP